ncbi:MAG: hypothetical protein AB7F40_05020 [Victivallaceae bacterium]
MSNDKKNDSRLEESVNMVNNIAPRARINGNFSINNAAGMGPKAQKITKASDITQKGNK